MPAMRVLEVPMKLGIYCGGLTLVAIGALSIVIGIHGIEVAVALIRQD
jgi:hypothetical protein